MGSRLGSRLMVLAASIFTLSTAAMLTGREPFATWYYSFAWWSYILFADSWLVARRQPGTLLRNPEAARLIGLSIVVWVSFEVYNFRLGNWYYLDLPAARAVRWAGYTVAYATVLPGIFVTWRWLRVVFPQVGGNRRPVSAPLLTTLFWAGLAASLLPWAWPRYFFPLVWLGPTAFFAAVNHRLGGEGILRDLAERGPSRLYLLVGAGGICGFLWELWNYWAKSKWVYDVPFPFFDELHVFEMPVAGFLGFLPFAVECHEMYWAGRKLLDRTKGNRLVYSMVWILLTAYVIAAFWGIDRFTVHTFQN